MGALAFAMTALLAVGLATGPALALDQLLNGKRLLVRDTGKRSVFNFQARDGAVTVPVGADAPTVVGARVQLVNPITGENRAFDMPASLWRANGAGTKFVYRDRRQTVGPVTLAILRNGRLLKVVMKATAITLDEPSQNALAVVLVSGGQRYCTEFGLDAIRRDEPCRFLARRSARPLQCPDGAISSATGAFVAGPAS